MHGQNLHTDPRAIGKKAILREKLTSSSQLVLSNHRLESDTLTMITTYI